MVHARRVSGNPLDAFGLGAFSLVGVAMGALLGTPSILKLFSGLTKEKTMTAMEKALIQVFKLLLQKYEELEAEAEKLRKRPTQETLADALRDNERLLRQNDALRADIEAGSAKLRELTERLLKRAKK